MFDGLIDNIEAGAYGRCLARPQWPIGLMAVLSLVETVDSCRFL